MDDSAEGRISLAYERLSRIPRPLADHFAQNTHTLDLSHNNIKYVYKYIIKINYHDIDGLTLNLRRRTEIFRFWPTSNISTH